MTQLISNPDTLNAVKDSLVKSESKLNSISFDVSRLLDGNTMIISVVGYAIVFLALLLLFVFLVNFPKLLKIKPGKIFRRKQGIELENESSDTNYIPGEVSAAIAAALGKHFAEVHDFENTVLTIKKVQRTYSPWSSKIYGLRETPKR